MSLPALCEWNGMFRAKYGCARASLVEFCTSVSTWQALNRGWDQPAPGDAVLRCLKRTNDMGCNRHESWTMRGAVRNYQITLSTRHWEFSMLQYINLFLVDFRLFYQRNIRTGLSVDYLCNNNCIFYYSSSAAGIFRVLGVSKMVIISPCYVLMGLFEIYVPVPLLLGVMVDFRERIVKFREGGAPFALDRPAIAAWYYYPVAAAGL